MILQRLGGAEQFYAYNIRQIVRALACFAGSSGPHRNVILLTGAGGDGVNAGWAGQLPIIGR